MRMKLKTDEGRDRPGKNGAQQTKRKQCNVPIISEPVSGVLQVSRVSVFWLKWTDKNVKRLNNIFWPNNFMSRDKAKIYLEFQKTNILSSIKRKSNKPEPYYVQFQVYLIWIYFVSCFEIRAGDQIRISKDKLLVEIFKTEDKSIRLSFMLVPKHFSSQLILLYLNICSVFSDEFHWSCDFLPDKQLNIVHKCPGRGLLSH